MKNYEMEGGIFSHEYQILRDNRTVVEINKQWFSFSDTYGVDIDDYEDQAFLIALGILIDKVFYDKNDR